MIHRALLLDCYMTDDSTVMCAQYGPEVLDGHQMACFLTLLGGLMKQFDSSHDGYHRTIIELDVATVEDRENT